MSRRGSQGKSWLGGGNMVPPLAHQKMSTPQVSNGWLNQSFSSGIMGSAGQQAAQNQMGGLPQQTLNSYVTFTGTSGTSITTGGGTSTLTAGSVYWVSAGSNGLTVMPSGGDYDPYPKNKFIAGSDLLEEFMEFLKQTGMGKNQALDRVTLRMFIEWMVIEAAKADGDVAPEGYPTSEALLDGVRALLPAPAGSLEIVGGIDLQSGVNGILTMEEVSDETVVDAVAVS